MGQGKVWAQTNLIFNNILEGEEDQEGNRGIVGVINS